MGEKRPSHFPDWKGYGREINKKNKIRLFGKAFKWKGELSWCSGGKIAFWGVYVRVCVCVCLCIHTHTCANPLIGVCGQLEYFMCTCKNLFIVNWTRANVLTTIYLLKSILPVSRPLAQRNLSQNRLPTRRLSSGEEECAVLPSVEDAPLQILVCCM